MDINTTVSTIYGLQQTEFEQLFEGEINHATLDTLQHSAQRGDLRSIDLLLNIALRPNKLGLCAEKILFGLFSQEIPAKVDIDKDIQQTCVQLWGIGFTGEDDDQKMLFPSALTYILGSTFPADSDMKLLMEDTFHQFGDARLKDEHAKDLWASDRYITAAEIDATVNKLTSSTPIPSFTVHSTIDLDLLVKNSFAGRLKLLNLESPHYFPVHIDEHWVLFGLYRDPQSNENKAVIFNSFPQLRGYTENAWKLALIANAVGVSDEHITTISNELQSETRTTTKNACGVFVCAALKHLAATDNALSPSDTLHQFVENFESLPEEDKLRFNMNQRRQSYGNLLFQVLDDLAQ